MIGSAKSRKKIKVKPAVAFVLVAVLLVGYFLFRPVRFKPTQGTVTDTNGAGLSGATVIVSYLCHTPNPMDSTGSKILFTKQLETDNAGNFSCEGFDLGWRWTTMFRCEKFISAMKTGYCPNGGSCEDRVARNWAGMDQERVDLKLILTQ